MKQSKQSQIEQMQLFEQNAQNFLMQKQQQQTKLLEIENAYDELKKSKDQVYKIVGPVMIQSNKVDLTKELDVKKEMIELRIKSIEKQENLIKQKIQDLQKEVLKETDHDKTQ